MMDYGILFWFMEFHLRVNLLDSIQGELIMLMLDVVGDSIADKKKF